MEFLDSISHIELDTCKKRAHRVRSWYLYEQYKSLEKNQLNAAKQLKDKSYQEKVLSRELNERKARRQLYDQLAQSSRESLRVNTRRVQSEGPSRIPSITSHDFFETISEVEKSLLDINPPELDSENNDIFSDFSSTSNKTYSVADSNYSVDMKDDSSCDESVKSVIDNSKLDNVADDVKEELINAKRDIAEDIKMQLETVKRNIKSLEKCTKVYDVISEDESLSREINVGNNEQLNGFENNLYSVWSKLVSFAYQVIQLNHGNSYYDFSSQFLTAVLACEVLRRSINKVCHILQPYVCPIKFATDDSDASILNKKILQKTKCENSMSRQPCGRKNCQDRFKINNNHRYIERKHRSENFWRYRTDYELENHYNENRRRSEPWRSVARFSTKSTQKDGCEKIYSYTSMDETRNKVFVCHGTVQNPMLNLAKYMDSMFDETGV